MKPFSRIISGTMTWGNWGKKLSLSEMQVLIEKSFNYGISTFDHADIYGGYTTEADFGNAFKICSIDRENVQFISKCGIQMPCEARPLNVKYYDYSSSHIRLSVENSLRNLKTEYIDLLLLHRPSPLMEASEICDVFCKLREEGKVNQLGVSNFTTSQIKLLQKEISLNWNQIECSLSHETPLFNGVLDYLKTQNIGVMSWSPLGIYFKSDLPKKRRIKKVITPLCKKYDCSEAQILLAWLLQHPSKIYPVIGTTSSDRIKKAIKATKINLDLTDWFLLLEASMGKPLP
tara:strand:+ start:1410 stop:2276 length:867 start_codon:yes stop_codon:yes gene_type:complete